MDRLEQLIEEYQSIQIAKNHLDKIDVLLLTEKTKVVVFAKMVEKEYEDIRKFEFFMVKGLFKFFLGDYESQFEIEKQEYLMAVLKYREAKKVVELWEFERKVIEQKLEKEAAIKKELDSYLEKRKTLFGEKYPVIKFNLIKYAKEQDEQIALRKEIQEALVICNDLDKLFNLIISQLEQAATLTVWSAEVGYKDIQDNYLDVAYNLVHKVVPLFRKLEMELEDVLKYKSIRKITMYEELIHFNDIYYDRLVSDWILRRKIKSTLNTTKDAHDTVKRISATLQAYLKKTVDAINDAKQGQEQLILEQINAPSAPSKPPQSDSDNL